MPPISDRLAAYRLALANWNYTGYIRLTLNVQAHNFLRRVLGLRPPKELGHLMFRHVEAGGEIDEVSETRPEWTDWEFHWDLRFAIGEEQVYVETRLHLLDKHDPYIEVVNIHEP